MGAKRPLRLVIYIPALSLEKTMYGYPKREKKSGLRAKIKSFHSGYPGLKVIHSKVPCFVKKKMKMKIKTHDFRNPFFEY